MAEAFLDTFKALESRLIFLKKIGNKDKKGRRGLRLNRVFYGETHKVYIAPE